MLCLSSLRTSAWFLQQQYRVGDVLDVLQPLGRNSASPGQKQPRPILFLCPLPHWA